MEETKPKPKPGVGRPANEQFVRGRRDWEDNTENEDDAASTNGGRRPKNPARSSAISAEKKVPAERMDTTKDFLHQDITKHTELATEVPARGLLETGEMA